MNPPRREAPGAFTPLPPGPGSQLPTLELAMTVQSPPLRVPVETENFLITDLNDPIVTDTGQPILVGV